MADTDNAWREKPQGEPLVPRCMSRPGVRSPLDYLAAARQFDVLSNPRYRARVDEKGNQLTWCNIYVWDVTSAMMAEVPHWVDALRRASKPGEHGATEQRANAMIDWLLEGRGGWRRIEQRDAFAEADKGKPVVVGYRAPAGKTGHVAMLLPNHVIAQAGATNLWLAQPARGFGNLPVQYFGHD